MRALMWSLSEYYIDNLAEETKKGHRETALKGLHNGGYSPFGYDVVNQQYVVNPIEAAFVRKIFDAARERRGFTEIIRELEAAGIRGKRREKPNAIRIENALPVIIDRAAFMEVQVIMNERKQSGRKADYLCSGLVYCQCGAKMHALKTHRRGMSTYTMPALPSAGRTR